MDFTQWSSKLINSLILLLNAIFRIIKSCYSFLDLYTVLPGGVCVCVCVRVLSCFLPFETPWTVASHASLSMEFSRWEYWSGLLCPPPGDLLTHGSNPHLLHLLLQQVDSLPLSHLGSSQNFSSVLVNSQKFHICYSCI